MGIHTRAIISTFNQTDIAPVELVEVSTPSKAETVLNRKSSPAKFDLSAYKDKRILVTGSSGSLGNTLYRALLPIANFTIGFDLVNNDNILHPPWAWQKVYQPDIVFHLAANKHAPEGEVDPYSIAHLNIQGTQNVIEAFPDATIVLASTCKAIEPETAYGASKLIAERMVLNHPKGRVARFYNVVETAGNVFETWDNLDPVASIPVTACERFFMSKEEAISLLLYAGHPNTQRGLYAFKTERHHMIDVAKRLYPDRPLKHIQRRRGDRLKEPRLSAYEFTQTEYGRIERIRGPHAGA